MKERKLSLFIGNMIVYVENLKIYKTKNLELITSTARSQDTGSIYKSQMLSYILAMNNWNLNFFKIPFAIALRYKSNEIGIGAVCGKIQNIDEISQRRSK